MLTELKDSGSSGLATGVLMGTAQNRPPLHVYPPLLSPPDASIMNGLQVCRGGAYPQKKEKRPNQYKESQH
ncbi:uncharacterized [Tachysurus ichikawai]